MSLGNRDLDLVAFFLSKQAATDRAGDQVLSRVIVFVAIADECDYFFVIQIEIHHFDRCAKRDFVFGNLVGINNLSPRQTRLRLVDSRLEQTLLLSLGVILRVLFQIALSAGFSDRFGNRGHLNVFHFMNLSLTFVVSFLSHWDALNHVSLLCGFCICKKNYDLLDTKADRRSCP